MNGTTQRVSLYLLSPGRVSQACDLCSVCWLRKHWLWTLLRLCTSCCHGTTVMFSNAALLTSENCSTSKFLKTLNIQRLHNNLKRGLLQFCNQTAQQLQKCHLCVIKYFTNSSFDRSTLSAVAAKKVMSGALGQLSTFNINIKQTIAFSDSTACFSVLCNLLRLGKNIYKNF